MSDSLLTITSTATERDLCTLAAVKDELGITASTFDSSLGTRIAQASAAIESYCGRIFARETVQEIFRPTASMETLILARFPVVTFTSIIADGDTLVSGTDYEADLASGIVYRLDSDQRTAWLEAKITATYQAGYLLPDQGSANLPADIQRACILAVASAHLGRGRDAMVRSESAQDVGLVSYLDPRAEALGLPPQVAGMLQPYMVRVI